MGYWNWESYIINAALLQSKARFHTTAGLLFSPQHTDRTSWKTKSKSLSQKWNPKVGGDLSFLAHVPISKVKLQQ